MANPKRAPKRYSKGHDEPGRREACGFCRGKNGQHKLTCPANEGVPIKVPGSLLGDPSANKQCGFRVAATGRLCGITATHEVTFTPGGVPVPACPTHRQEAALDPHHEVAIRRLRLR